MKHYGDVNKINGAEVEPVDIITFGSPCQDLSVAGKRAGIQDGERSNLFFEAIRIIKEMRKKTNGEYPKYAVWENVPGAFSSNKGHDFHAVLEAFCSVCDDTISIPKPYDAKQTDKLVWNKAGEIVGDNYSIAWRTLDAQYWGVPQRRKRIYLVADFTGRRAGEILFKPESLRGDMQEGNEAGEGATTDAVGSVDGSVGVECLNPWDCQSKRIYNPDGIYCTLPAMDCGGANNQAVIFSFDSLSSNSMKSSNPFSGCRAVDVAKCIDTTYPDPSKNQGGVAVVECIGYDMYNQASTGDKTRTLKTPAGGDDLPVVCVLNDQGGSSINVESEETSPTLRANSHQHEPVIAFAQNQREEVRDLGDKAGALAAEAGVHQQTYIAQPVIALQANGIDRAAGFCQGASPAARTIGYQEELSPTAKGASSGTAQVPAVVIALQANGIDRADTAGCNGAGWRENESYTLNTVDRHAVCYDARNHNAQDISGTIQAKSNGGQSLNFINPVCYDARENGDGETACTITGDHQNRITDYTAVAVQETYQDKTGPLMANSHPGSYTGQDVYSDMLVAGKAPETLCFDETQITSPANGNNPQWNEPSHPLASTARPPTVICKKPPRKYIIRRLTPTECARLQGFPDWWSELAPYNPADAEFWEQVRKTHAEINGKKYKPVKDVKKWYDKLHTDSAEYKMWGNGLALPNAEYVLRGIAEHGAKTLGSLFDGSGGFPLAGVLNGIKPIWASEVEPYPIAVTKSRFKEEKK